MWYFVEVYTLIVRERSFAIEHEVPEIAIWNLDVREWRLGRHCEEMVSAAAIMEVISNAPFQRLDHISCSRLAIPDQNADNENGWDAALVEELIDNTTGEVMSPGEGRREKPRQRPAMFPPGPKPSHQRVFTRYR
jgi:hypothetical protein